MIYIYISASYYINIIYIYIYIFRYYVYKGSSWNKNKLLENAKGWLRSTNRKVHQVRRDDQLPSDDCATVLPSQLEELCQSNHSSSSNML